MERQRIEAPAPYEQPSYSEPDQPRADEVAIERHLRTFDDRNGERSRRGADRNGERSRRGADRNGQRSCGGRSTRRECRSGNKTRLDVSITRIHLCPESALASRRLTGNSQSYSQL